MNVQNNSQRRMRMPAEWHAQSGVQLAWPEAKMDWAPYLDDIRQTYVALIQAITDYEPVLLLAADVAQAHDYLQAHLDDAHMGRVRLFAYEHDDTWARDYGLITLLSDKGEPTLLDFRFNGWGEKFPAEADNQSGWLLFRRGLLAGAHVDYGHFVLEGGSIESDGRGTIFTTAPCLLAPHRNQPLTQQEITQQLARQLHADRIVWLHHGTLIGDDTDGHIDTIVRTAPDDTLVYVKCDNPDDPQYEDFRLLEEELQALRTLEGKPYRLISVPMPDAIHYDGERLPATYANFLVVNGAVIVPTYGQPANDRVALQRVGEAFPGRDIVGIDARVIIRQHGSIHCLTMQYPEGVLRV